MIRGLVYLTGLVTLLVIGAVAAVAFRVDRWPWRSYAEDGRQYLVEKLDDAEFTEVTGRERGDEVTAQPNDPRVTVAREPAEVVPLMVPYTVRRGDTLYRIAAKYYGVGEKWELIADANGIRKPSDLRVGKVVLVPMRTASKYKRERSWTLEPRLALTPAYVLDEGEGTKP